MMAVARFLPELKGRILSVALSKCCSFSSVNLSPQPWIISSSAPSVAEPTILGRGSGLPSSPEKSTLAAELTATFTLSASRSLAFIAAPAPFMSCRWFGWVGFVWGR